MYSAKNTAHHSDVHEGKEVHSNDNQEFNDSDSDSDEGDADPANDNVRIVLFLEFEILRRCSYVCYTFVIQNV